jgi:hypothetical protein
LGVQYSAEGSEGVPTAHAFGGYWTFFILPKAFPDNSEIVNLHSSIVNGYFANRCQDHSTIPWARQRRPRKSIDFSILISFKDPGQLLRILLHSAKATRQRAGETNTSSFPGNLLCKLSGISVEVLFNLIIGRSVFCQRHPRILKSLICILQSLIAISLIVVRTIAQSMGRASGTPRRF